MRQNRTGRGVGIHWAVQLLVLFFLAGCATHELVLSKSLRPVLSSSEIDFQPSLFRARVNKGVLEVWGRIERSDSDYQRNFDIEIRSAAALCAALAKSDLTFQNNWYKLELWLINEYGSQWRWKNTTGSIWVNLSREKLLEIGKHRFPAAECPRYWNITGSKSGPPDYLAYDPTETGRPESIQHIGR